MIDIINRAFCSDCEDFMADIPDKYFDLVLTDPPYGIDINYFMRGGKITKGGLAMRGNYDSDDTHIGSIPSKNIINEIIRVSKHQIIFGGNYFADMLPPSSCWLVWDKLNGSSHYADCELAWTSFDKAVRKYSFRWNGMLQHDMKNKEQRHHPTQKPVELFKMILRDYAIRNGFTKIFDPYIGSGTTAIASKSLGLDWSGCDIKQKYIDITNKRLESVQAVLF